MKKKEVPHHESLKKKKKETTNILQAGFMCFADGENKLYKVILNCIH